MGHITCRQLRMGIRTLTYVKANIYVQTNLYIYVCFLALPFRFTDVQIQPSGLVEHSCII